MKFLKLIVLLAVITNLMACGIIKKTQTNSSDGWKTSSYYDFSISYPDDWTPNQSGIKGENLMLISPYSLGQKGYIEKLTLHISYLTHQYRDLDTLVDVYENQIKKTIVDGEIIKSKRKSAKGKKYHKIIYTSTTRDVYTTLSDIYKLKYVMYIWIVDNKAYALTMICEENQFRNYNATGKKIFKSFNYNKN